MFCWALHEPNGSAGFLHHSWIVGPLAPVICLSVTILACCTADMMSGIREVSVGGMAGQAKPAPSVMSPFKDWQELAWAGVFLITLGVLVLNILARLMLNRKISG